MVGRRGKTLSFQELINKVASLGRSKKSNSKLNSSDDPACRTQHHSSSSEPTATRTSAESLKSSNNMAEEEDFSSLPLPDRFVHKVRCDIPTKMDGTGTDSVFVSVHRSGKFENKHTKMLPSSLRRQQTNTTQPLDPLSRTPACGKAPRQTRM